ncbi:MAG: fumarylacetoacetate hydrolase family protein [Lautropia sp.]|nr:fumarylacetoacetate hydrolase family protein [Lautropia sp.]
MKLASRKDGTRDGQLTVVSRDLKHAVLADQIVGTLQRALDDWRFFAPQLQDLYEQLNQGRAPRSFDFNPLEYQAPLPRPVARIETAAYPGFLKRLKKAGLLPPAIDTDAAKLAGAEAARHLDATRTTPDGLPSGYSQPGHAFQLLPTSRIMPAHTPVSCRGLALHLLQDDDEPADTADGQAAKADTTVPATAAHPNTHIGLDFSAQLIAITDDVPMDLDPDEAEACLLLLGMANGWRHHPPGLNHWLGDRGLACAPVLLSPDELGEDWRDGRLHRPLHCRLNGRSTGRIDTADGMAPDFRELLAALSQHGPLHAGTLISTGPIANTSPDSGTTSILEARARHQIDGLSSPAPAFLQPGNRIRLDMSDQRGHSLFGTIDQPVVP